MLRPRCFPRGLEAFLAGLLRGHHEMEVTVMLRGDPSLRLLRMELNSSDEHSIYNVFIMRLSIRLDELKTRSSLVMTTTVAILIKFFDVLHLTAMAKAADPVTSSPQAMRNPSEHSLMKIGQGCRHTF